jgi:hypothetical protein
MEKMKKKSYFLKTTKIVFSNDITTEDKSVRFVTEYSKLM